MKHGLKFLGTFLFVSFYQVHSFAFSFNANLFYFSDTLTEASNSSDTNLFYDLDFMIYLTKKGSFNVGWSYSSQNLTNSNSTDTTYAITEMGPKFTYYIDKQKNWGLGFTYFLQSNATYKASSTTLKWRGGSYKVQFGYLQEVTETFYVGVNINYHTSSFTEQFTTANTFSTISYSRSILYPSLQITYRN